MEEWRPCEEVPEYSVSTLGRVRRDVDAIHPTTGHVVSPSGLILTPHFERNGYARVCLTLRPGLQRNRTVHRLVCIAFHGAPPTLKHTVNHKNGNKADNSADNLEWATHQENVRHAWRVLGRTCPVGEQMWTSKLTESAVLDIRTRRAAGEKLRAIAERHGVSTEAVYRIVHRKNWRHI